MLRKISDLKSKEIDSSKAEDVFEKIKYFAIGTCIVFLPGFLAFVQKIAESLEQSINNGGM